MIVGAIANSTSVSSSLSVNPELFALTVSAIIGAVVAVAATFSVQYYLNRPKIRGNILNFISANFSGQFPDVRGKVSATMVFPYALLTNQHQNAASMFDFMLDVDVGKGWLRMEKVLGDDNFYKQTLPNALILDAGDRILKFPNLDKALLERKLKPIEFGDYIHGFLMFASKTWFLGKDIKKMRLTCIDVFENKHVIMHPKKRWFFLRKKREGYSVPFYIFEQNAGAVSEWKKG